MLIRAFYNGLLLPLALVLALPLALVHGKLRRSLLARWGVWRRLRRAELRRDPSMPLVWFHAASAGELLQAEPVLRRCVTAGAQVAVTLTSVSALAWRTRLDDMPGLVWADMLPLDFGPSVGRMWRVLRPAVVVHLQAELWPGLVLEVARRGTPQVLLAARLSPRAGRVRSALGRALYRPLYRRMATIQALSEADREALARLVPGHPALEVGGDPGIETAVRRVQQAAPTRLPAAFASGEAAVLVAGSTWPADEALLVPVLEQALEEHPALRAILAPHEPNEAHLAPLEAALAAWRPVRFSTLTGDEADGTRVVLVDTVGRLAGLYAAGTIAYVGGGFTTGVHNVAEPAAAGLPVLFGPRHGNSAVARTLLEAGAAVTVRDAEALRTALRPLLADPAAARETGARARETVEGLAGAAERAFAAVRPFVPGL